ncbi:GNAT family N-acetyltransferase [Tumebacillus sp. DT12]|uniref:GNAT family N-acetyltransferase n=1 Tax=Tumebacillus lacus TaxID=2995335 RepID=A0ABT3X3R7_9BACL|nr:GNAT family N-acetyltransferase [Tumebacillus lacus]MCX7571539.1 GNAT family N-acetyltransferase [Tumebacillus lacus]
MTRQTATIRPAEERDVARLSELMYEYICDFYQRPRPPETRVVGLIRTLLDHQAGIQFVAEQNGDLLGFATLYFTYSTTVCDKSTVMNDLYLTESARGTSAAESLFRACQSYTREHGYAWMSWETAPDNHRAQRFYEKMGAQKGPWVTYSI